MARVISLLGLLGVALGLASQALAAEERRLLQGVALVLFAVFLAALYLWWKALGVAIRLALLVLALGAVLLFLGRLGVW